MKEIDGTEIGKRLFWTDPPPEPRVPMTEDIHGKIGNTLDRIFSQGVSIEDAIRQIAPLFPGVVFKQKDDDIEWHVKPKTPVRDNVITPRFRRTQHEK